MGEMEFRNRPSIHFRLRLNYKCSLKKIEKIGENAFAAAAADVWWRPPPRLL